MPSERKRQEHAQRGDLLEHLRAHVAELTRPWWSEVHRRRFDTSTGVWGDVTERVGHPALLDQFADTSRAADDMRGAGKGPSSRPLARMGVLDAEREIREGTSRHPGVVSIALQFGAPLATATDVRAALVWLNAKAVNLDTSDVAGLEASARLWRTRAREALGYDEVPHEPRVPCMRCGQFSTVRFTVEPLRAWCVGRLEDGSACGAEWDAATIGVFGEWCRTWEQDSDGASAPADDEGSTET